MENKINKKRTGINQEEIEAYTEQMAAICLFQEMSNNKKMDNEVARNSFVAGFILAWEINRETKSAERVTKIINKIIKESLKK